MPAAARAPTPAPSRCRAKCSALRQHDSDLDCRRPTDRTEPLCARAGAPPKHRAPRPARRRWGRRPASAMRSWLAAVYCGFIAVYCGFIAVYCGSSLSRRIHSGLTRKGRVWTAPRRRLPHGIARFNLRYHNEVRRKGRTSRPRDARPATSPRNHTRAPVRRERRLQGSEIPAADPARADSDNLDCGPPGPEQALR